MNNCLITTGSASFLFEVPDFTTSRQASSTRAKRDINDVYEELDRRGWATLPGVMAEPEIDQLLSAFQGGAKRGSEEQLRALSPCEQCLTGPLPEPLESWGRALRSALTPIAHRWKSDVGHSRLFSSSASVKSVCEPPALHARLTYLFADQMQALGHDAARGEAFPIQMVVLLSEPDRDFVGGEFVIADQRPRMHSRPMVIPLNKGDAALIATSQRPVKGQGGVCQVTLRHGVSRLRSGNRIALELSLG